MPKRQGDSVGYELEWDQVKMAAASKPKLFDYWKKKYDLSGLYKAMQKSPTGRVTEDTLVKHRTKNVDWSDYKDSKEAKKAAKKGEKMSQTQAALDKFRELSDRLEQRGRRKREFNRFEGLKEKYDALPDNKKDPEDEPKPPAGPGMEGAAKSARTDFGRSMSKSISRFKSAADKLEGSPRPEDRRNAREMRVVENRQRALARAAGRRRQDEMRQSRLQSALDEFEALSQAFDNFNTSKGTGTLAKNAASLRERDKLILRGRRDKAFDRKRADDYRDSGSRPRGVKARSSFKDALRGRFGAQEELGDKRMGKKNWRKDY